MYRLFAIYFLLCNIFMCKLCLRTVIRKNTRRSWTVLQSPITQLMSRGGQYRKARGGQVPTPATPKGRSCGGLAKHRKFLTSSGKTQYVDIFIVCLRHVNFDSKILTCLLHFPLISGITAKLFLIFWMLCGMRMNIYSERHELNIIWKQSWEPPSLLLGEIRMN